MLQYSEQVKKRRQQHEKIKFCYAFSVSRNGWM
ncbi:conserved hypothetical protein [Bacillus cereus Q1]|uniref:Uncharacterized protein n=1 Tax=Bacillus cereus (strain Q1) TaxID=361100 RepID=B9IWI6_BACCQ|nr:conserved hypothetical protein [Bacillus cereus Q1]